MKNLINETIWNVFTKQVGLERVGKGGEEAVIGTNHEEPLTLSGALVMIVKAISLGDMFREGQYGSKAMFSNQAYFFVEYEDLEAKANEFYRKAVKRILYLNTVCKHGYDGQVFVGRGFINDKIDLDNPRQLLNLCDSFVELLGC